MTLPLTTGMASELTAAPVLSTPDDYLFEHRSPDRSPEAIAKDPKTDGQIRDMYEITRTAREIRAVDRKRVALQFPDHMLGDAPRVVELLKRELQSMTASVSAETNKQPHTGNNGYKRQLEVIYILADTSYSPCCVDEIAAEHMNADLIVHYGRSCLSPTARLPVIYVFTKHKLDFEAAMDSFEAEYTDKEAKVVLVADVTYHDQVAELYRRVRAQGYTQVLSTRIQHNPLGRIPNRTVIDSACDEVDTDQEKGVIDLKQYAIFHVSSPPAALLLALSTRVASLKILPTPEFSSSSHYTPIGTTRALLGRRYAKILSLTTAGIVGILVNTLSIAHYLSSVAAIRKQIAAAGKKSYTVVVGKLNAAKLANFAEIDAWVVVGCWESSLVEEDAGFYRPVLTPFELGVALMPDEERVWGLSWWGGTETVLTPSTKTNSDKDTDRDKEEAATMDSGVDADQDESDVPVFDLRTGTLVSSARPMRRAAGRTREEQQHTARPTSNRTSDALVVRPKAELATIQGLISPGAEYLRSRRTWQGLGSDFDEERSAQIKEGRRGVARGYTVGSEADRT